MSGQAMVILILVGGFVWGGFLVLLLRALRMEGAKQREAEADDAGVDPGAGLR